MTDIKTEIVALTDAARREVTRLLETEGKEGVGLRLEVQGGGCSGLSYNIDFTRRCLRAPVV